MLTEKLNVYICGLDEVPNYHYRNITHILSLADPGTKHPYISHFGHQPRVFRVEFHDVDSSNASMSDVYLLPNETRIRYLISVFNIIKGLLNKGDVVNFLIHCHAGRRRSTAAAYILWNILLGPGHEQECLNKVYHARPIMSPNDLMTSIADDLLDRKGEMLKWVVNYNKKFDLGI